MLAQINNTDYNITDLKHSVVSGVEFLKVLIDGELKEESNNLHIDYEGKHYFGYKQIPHPKGNGTEFYLYIYQPGDSEMEVNCANSRH